MQKEDRNIYIENMEVEEAQKRYHSKLKQDNNLEEINVLDSLNRITYKAVFAKKSSPFYNAAAMDGILVRAEDTYGATEVTPKILEVNKDFIYVNTGNPIPPEYDAVIMIEDVIEIEEGKVSILKGAYPWQHIRPVGEDIVAFEMIIPSNHKIRPIDLGALISGGIEKIKVYKKPKVGILPTGSEIIEDIKNITNGRIIDSNSRVFKGLVEEYGGIPNRYSPIKDDYNLLKKEIKKGVKDNDILIINAGSSAGSKDFTAQIIRELGKVVVHGVALKPGKPTILGIVDEKPVIGIPGYPVSSYIVFETFVKPLIYNFIGSKEEHDKITKAIISKRVVSSFKNKELIRVNLGFVNKKLLATPLSKGAGVTMSLVKADGIATIPRNSEGVEAGEEIEVRLLKSMESIREKLVSVGSHDLIMDIISDMMPLSSGHVGSMGGILAMKRGEANISPIHLLDPDIGDYNISFVKKYLQEKKMTIIKGVKRMQGFMVQKGNPQNIKGFSDLTRKDVQFVNRQRGAGTRVLLDYNLNKRKINPQDIPGYHRELTTHMAVAMAVKSGSATTGLGIMSAAKVMDLDFVEVGYEDYDFLVSYEFLQDEKIKDFINILKSQKFKERIEKLEGYKLENCGDVIII